MANVTRKIDLLRSLVGKEVAHNGPYHVTIDVTRRCNLNCIGCRYHSMAIENVLSPGNQEILDLDPGVFQKLCRDLAKLGTRAIELSGEGEPFVSRNLFELITIAKECSLDVTVFSNGTLLDSRHIESIINSRLDSLKITLWAATRQIYENNYPGTNPEYFDRIVEGLSGLSLVKKARASIKPKVTLHHPINRHNFRTLDKVVELACKAGCDGISFSPLKKRRGSLASLSLQPDEEREVLSRLVSLENKATLLGMKHNIKETMRRYEVGEEVWRKFPCYVGFITMRVKVDGTVVPCNPCNIPMGNINDESFVEIWNNEAYKNFRRKALTREGLASMNADCDCGYCCYLNDNVRIHRIYKWIAPIMT